MSFGPVPGAYPLCAALLDEQVDGAIFSQGFVKETMEFVGIILLILVLLLVALWVGHFLSKLE
jgi:hypothetical protein